MGPKRENGEENVTQARPEGGGGHKKPSEEGRAGSA